MAVVANADPIDRALSDLGDLMDKSAPLDIADQLIAASMMMSLWRVVADHAVATHDARLLEIAAREIEHTRAAFGSLLPP